MKSLTGIRLAALLLAGGLSQIANTAEPTAFDLVKEGNRHLGEEAKGRVVQIRSEKSVGGLTPNIWFVVYYDPDATAKATEIKFAAGTKVSVKRPARVLEPITGAHLELPKEKLKIDSDKAIEIALAHGGKEFLAKNKDASIRYTLSFDGRNSILRWIVSMESANAKARPLTVILNASSGEFLRKG